MKIEQKTASYSGEMKMKKTLTACLFSTLVGISSLSMGSSAFANSTRYQQHTIVHGFEMYSGIAPIDQQGVFRRSAVIKVEIEPNMRPLVVPFYQSTGLNSAETGTVFPFLGMNLYKDDAGNEVRHNSEMADDWVVKPPFEYTYSEALHLYNAAFLHQMNEDKRHEFKQNLSVLVRNDIEECDSIPERSARIYCYIEKNQRAQNLLLRFGTLKMAEVSYQFGGGVWNDKTVPLTTALATYFRENGDIEGSLGFSAREHVYSTALSHQDIALNKVLSEHGFNFESVDSYFKAI